MTYDFSYFNEKLLLKPLRFALGATAISSSFLVIANVGSLLHIQNIYLLLLRYVQPVTVSQHRAQSLSRRYQQSLCLASLVARSLGFFGVYANLRS